MKDVEKELESLRKQVALLEELVALRARVDELTRQLAPQVPYIEPLYPYPTYRPVRPQPRRWWGTPVPFYPTGPIIATATQTVTGLKEGSVSSTYILDDMRDLGWSNTVNGPEA